MAKKKIEILGSGHVEINAPERPILPNKLRGEIRIETINNAFVLVIGDSYISKSGHVCELAIDAHFYPTRVKAQQALNFITANTSFLKW